MMSHYVCNNCNGYVFSEMWQAGFLYLGFLEAEAAEADEV